MGFRGRSAWSGGSLDHGLSNAEARKGWRRMNDGIAVAYSGVHQAYQLALAAQELGRLDRFYCSMFAAKGKWGGVFARLLGSDALVNRRVDGLSSKKVCENPWPLITHRL